MEPVKFEFSRPMTPRVIDIEYISPPVCLIAYPGTSGETNGVSQL
jgi:hypothetical protein